MSKRLPLFFLSALLFAGTARAQIPAPAGGAESKDPLGRDTPQSSILRFLEACHSRDYSKAAYYLDLRKLPQADRSKAGPELALQLEDLLDDTTFDIATLSRSPEGDQSDGLGTTFEHLATFHVDGQDLNMQLERQTLNGGVRVWVVSAPSVAMIPTAHQVVAETSFEKKLPQELVTFEVLDTPVWRWIALAGMAVALWFIAGGVSWLVLRTLRSVAGVQAFLGPSRLLLMMAGFRLALELAPPSTIPRLILERLVQLIFVLGLAWGASIVIDFFAGRWHARLDPRVQAVSYSVLPLGRQVIKLGLYLFALLSVLAAWGYNTSTILAGLGVGGLAVALAAQKTIENLFGGVSVIGDRPVLVGDVCRFGDRTGTVMHIGLRSTRLRTPERTVISVPNGQFSTMTLENISGRDKIWFHPTLNLRRDTTSIQLSQVLDSCRDVLAGEPKVETGQIPVRFIGVGAYSLDVEINAYVKTADYDEFLAVQQRLLLKLLKAVEDAGTALAIPLQENIPSQKTSQPNS
ncbi:MAG TPA: mechanosensitive ion channel family protein [Bryobacteraceae bacterium]|jgi:MscS family membrane protein|nr:mechanosensitive ion channel family protein [Bryobacteraceae bacterium]